MRRALKLAAVVGGIGALAWGMRKRIRIAIRRGENPDPEFRIIDPAPESAENVTPDEPQVNLTDLADGDADGAPDSPPDGDPDGPESGVSNGAG